MKPTRSQIDAMTREQAKTWAENNGGKTGAPPGLLQDDSRKLSRALANAPHARQHVREVCAQILNPESWSEEATARAMQEDYERRVRLAQSSVDDY